MLFCSPTIVQSYRSLSVGSNRRTSLIDKALPPTSWNSTDCCAWNSQEISTYRNIQTSPSGANNHASSKSPRSHFSPHVNITWTAPYLHDFMHCTAATWLSDWILIARMCWCTGSLNIVFSECTIETGHSPSTRLGCWGLRVLLKSTNTKSSI